MKQNEKSQITEEVLLETIEQIMRNELVALIQKEKHSLFIRFLGGQRFSILVKEEESKNGLID